MGDCKYIVKPWDAEACASLIKKYHATPCLQREWADVVAALEYAEMHDALGQAGFHFYQRLMETIRFVAEEKAEEVQ